jgi:uncharacterized protein YoxC
MMLWIIDAALCVVLIGVMIVGTKLWHKIDIMKSSQGELQELMRQLNGATERANMAVVQLRATIKEADAKLGERLSKARAVSDELSIITDSGDRLASRLADRLSDQAAADPGRPAPRRVRVTQDSAPAAPSKSDKDALAKILQGLR